MPPWQYEQRKNAAEIDTLSPTEFSSKKHVFVWAWIDKTNGLIRARTFAQDWGIPEDEANGSGAMMLAATLGRSVEILHGKGSVIYARPQNAGFADLGGQVIEEK